MTADDRYERFRDLEVVEVLAAALLDLDEGDVHALPALTVRVHGREVPVEELVYDRANNRLTFELEGSRRRPTAWWSPEDDDPTTVLPWDRVERRVRHRTPVSHALDALRLAYGGPVPEPGADEPPSSRVDDR